MLKPFYNNPHATAPNARSGSGVTPPAHLEQALRNRLNGWLERIDDRTDAPDPYRERARVLVVAALDAPTDGLTPYETVVEVAAAFAGSGDTRVVIMPLTDGQIGAGQATLAAWAEADG